MENLEVIARFKVRPGQLEGLTAQAAELLRVTREKDTHTLRCDWFVNGDGTECEVHELFPNEQGLIEHKMNTMEATGVLFRDYAFDHHSTIYGEVSQDFIKLATERMGAPTVFRFFQGLQLPASVSGSGTGALQVTARLKVRPGQLDAVKTRMAEIVTLTSEKDTRTLRYDVFLSEDGTQCEVHEAYLGEEGLIEHNEHVVQTRDAMFRDCAFEHSMSVYGDISPYLTEMFKEHAGGVRRFSFAQGLAARATV